MISPPQTPQAFLYSVRHSFIHHLSFVPYRTHVNHSPASIPPAGARPSSSHPQPWYCTAVVTTPLRSPSRHAFFYGQYVYSSALEPTVQYSSAPRTYSAVHKVKSRVHPRRARAQDVARCNSAFPQREKRPKVFGRMYVLCTVLYVLYLLRRIRTLSGDDVVYAW